MMFGGGLLTKWVELLKETVPRLTRVGFVHDAGNPLTRQFVPEMRQATQALGLKFQDLEIHKLAELDSVCAAMSKERSGSLIVMGEALFFPHRSHLPDIAAKYGLPVLYALRVFVDAGGLMSYGPSLPDVWRRAATYVDKILKGANPAELPVEQPSTFELVINLKIAKALGLTIPPSLLQRADQVIE